MSATAPLNGRPYANNFGVLRELTNTGERIINFCRSNLLSLLDDKVGAQLKILSVGYGTGAIEAEVLTFLKPHFARIRFDGVEPNEVHAQQFRLRLETPRAPHASLMECARNKGIDLSTKTITLEEFQPEVAYDLVLLSHVLYYPADKAAALRRVLSFLSTTGILIIFQQTPAGLNEMQRLFASDLTIPPHYYSSVEVQTVLEEEGVGYQTTLFDQVIDVSDVLRGEALKDMPRRGMALLSFLCERDIAALHEANSTEVDWAALQRLRDFIWRTSFQRGDRRLLFYPTAAIVASRASRPTTLALQRSRPRPWREFRSLDLETVVVKAALLPDLLRMRADDRPSHPILEFGHQTGRPTMVTASQLYAAVQRMAVGLQYTGVKQKERVAMLSAPSAACFAVLSAIWHLGAVAVPLSLALPANQLVEQLRIARAGVVLVSDAWAGSHPETIETLTSAADRSWRLGVFDQQSSKPAPSWAQLTSVPPVVFGEDAKDLPPVEPPLHPDDLAAILFSSGTTGVPKAVPLTHMNITFSAHTRNASWPSLVNEDTRVLGWMPLNHVMGLVVEWATTTLYSGGTLVLPSRASGAASPESLLADARAGRATTISCVPWMLSQLRRLASSDPEVLATLKGLRYVLYGGAPMERKDVEWLRANGVRLQQGMGMTEVGTLFVAPEDPAAPIDELCPLRGFHYRLRPVAKDEGTDGKQRQQHDEASYGEVLVRSLSVTPGYLNRAAGEGFSDGYYCTGDVFARLPNGRYRFECRVDDLLVLPTGEKLNPVAVEAQIRDAAPLVVAQVCLVSGPALPVALVEPNWTASSVGVTLQQMKAEVWAAVAKVNETLPSYARLQNESVWVLDRAEPPLPTTRKHVVDRPAVRRRFAAALDGLQPKARPARSVSPPDAEPRSPAPLQLSAGEISTIVGDILGIRVQPGDFDRSLIELGLSSFFAVQLAVTLLQRRPQLTTAAVLSCGSISTLARLVSEGDGLEAPAAAPAESLLFWFTRKPSARVRLLLVNDMGGTASDFAKFDRWAPPDVEVVALNLPGHRGRPNSAYFKDIASLVDAFVAEAAPQLSDKPLAIYGQCMGGHVAYELTLALQGSESASAVKGLRLKRLVVGGCPSPSAAVAFTRSVAGIRPTEAELRALLEPAAVAGAGGSSERHALLLDALYEWYGGDMIADHAMFLPTLQRYLHATQPLGSVSVPLTACYGRHDDTVSAAEVMAWHSVAAGEFDFQLSHGSHALFAEIPFIRWLCTSLLAF